MYFLSFIIAIMPQHTGRLDGHKQPHYQAYRQLQEYGVRHLWLFILSFLGAIFMFGYATSVFAVAPCG